ncbi:MAG: colanic acid biosynthesis glycosyltransferase WcaI [Burkholderiales bacterium]|jgi:colanic acid biosynthesis glycosyl transferase WcaI|nr:MAG: colanic acid biosynthesis glycosyltransferase WcaI [Burkholderiales bacterium]
MKILIYSANYAPEPTGIGKYSGEMAEWLAAKGHDVRVVAAPPYYPNWKIAEGYQWPPYRRESLHGVDVWRAPLWVPSNPGGVKRVLHLLSFAASSIPVMLRQTFWNPDVVLTVAPAMACAPVGWLTARLCGATAWLHVQDFEVDVAFQMNLLKGKRLKSLALGLERAVLKRFDKVSTISSKMADKLRQKGVDNEAITLFSNWVDTAGVNPLAGPSSYRQELGIKPEQTVALFSGTWGNKQNLLAIPAAARQLTHRQDIVFVICGDGVMRPELEAACKGLSNVKLMPLQPKERLGELLGLADMHLLTQSAEAEDLVLPSKLTGMLSSGRPVIATCRQDTELAHVVSHCGIVVAPDDGAALVQAVVTLADSPERLKELGGYARAHAEQSFAKEHILGRWLVEAERTTLAAGVVLSEHEAN